MVSPAGVRLRRWLVFFAGLLLVLGASAFAASLTATRSLQAAAREGDALARHAAFVQWEVSASLRELRAPQPGPGAALVHLDSLTERLTALRATPLPAEVAAQAARVQETAAELRTAAALARSRPAGDPQRTRVDALGKDLEGLSTALADTAREGRERGLAAAAASSETALWLTGFSVLVALAAAASIPRWWSRFQDLILGL